MNDSAYQRGEQSGCHRDCQDANPIEKLTYGFCVAKLDTVFGIESCMQNADAKQLNQSGERITSTSGVAMAKKSVIGLILMALIACQRAEAPKAKTESPPPAPAPRLDRDSAPVGSYAPIVDRVAPSVVTIRSARRTTRAAAISIFQRSSIRRTLRRSIRRAGRARTGSPGIGLRRHRASGRLCSHQSSRDRRRG